MSQQSTYFRFLLRTLVLFLCFYSELLAQPSNYEFYPHDYARSPLDGPDSVGNNDLNRKDPKEQNNKIKTPSSASKGQQGIFEIKGKAIESFGLITSGIDHAAMTANLKTMLEVYNKKNVRPSTVIAIGENAKEQPEELQKLQKRLTMLGALFPYAVEPPKNFKIEKVPAWILTLKEGDVVLEGIDSPERFINSKGEFMDPNQIAAVE